MPADRISPINAVRPLVRRTALGYWTVRERRSSKPPTAILILGHMRSGSSLLCHLLMAHPAILGCGERNRAYAGNAEDAVRLAAIDIHVRRRRLLRRSRWLVDQVNHGRFLPDPALLDHPLVRPVFLLRAPRPSIASMADVLGRHYGMTVDEAVDYYRRRLDQLAGCARSFSPGRAFALDYDQLIDRPEAALAALGRHLGLPPPALGVDYPTHRFTGGAGDPSRHIRAGTIVRTPARTIDLDDGTTAALDAAYDECRHTLARTCVMPDRDRSPAAADAARSG